MDIQQLYKLYQEHPVLTTDSRDCPEGSMFFALKGASFDGNRFAAAALEKGCAYVVVDEPEVVPDGVPAHDKREEITDCGGGWLLVDNALLTLKHLAREHRRQFHIPVIGITGTNGKTTTKELVTAVLAEKYRVHATKGNFNNDVGVPKTLLGMAREDQMAVIEMGASHLGDIRTLAETAEPTCGLITNVGMAHLQGFGSFKGVVKTKGELYDFLAKRDDSVVFINADDQHLVDILPDNVWVTPYSTHVDNAWDCIVGELTAQDPFVSFRWREPQSELDERGEKLHWHQVETRLVGAYNLYNLLAAVAVGVHFEVPAELICHALSHYEPTNNRSQFVTTAHNHLIVDAYNANPTSMSAALDNFEAMKEGPKMAILGQMNELGDASDEEHRRIVNKIRGMNLTNVWLVGDNYADIKCHYRKFHDVDEVKAAIATERPEGCYILIKGSNSTRLYELPELL